MQSSRISRTVLYCLFLFSTPFASLIHVSPAGTDSGNGSDTAAFDSIQRGINQAVDGDTILLEDGIYHQHNIHFNGKKITVASRFVIDSSIAHIANTVIDGDNSGADSGSVFAIIHGEDTLSALRGVTVTRGTGTQAGNYGGGICLSNSSILIANCIIKTNTANFGGGIYAINASALKIVHSEISGNQATGQIGGGMCLFGSFALMDSCVISGNSAFRYGGGILSSGGGLTIAGSEIKNNTSLSGSGGGGIYFSGEKLVLTGVSIVSNVSSNNGGGVYVTGVVREMAFTQSRIIQNQASMNGGGIFTTGASTPNFTNTIIASNVSQNISTASGSYHYGGNTLMTSCTIYNNSIQLANQARITVTNSILSTPPRKDLGSIVQNFRYNLVINELVDSLGVISNLNPDFLNPGANDFHLKAISVGIDAGDPSADYSREPFSDSMLINQRINLGAYGNTGEAALAGNNSVMVLSPTQITDTLFQNEIANYTLRIMNWGSSPMMLTGIESSGGEIGFLGFSKNLLVPFDTAFARFSAASAVAGSTLVNGVIYSTASNKLTLPFNLEILSVNDTSGLFLPRSVEWPFTRMGGRDTTVIYLKNSGHHSVKIDSVTMSFGYFLLLTNIREATLAPGDSIFAKLSFNPTLEGDFTSYLRIFSPQYNQPDSIVLSGTSGKLMNPVAAIVEMNPVVLIWGDSITIRGSGSDSDQIGTAPPIRSYEWRYNGAIVGTGAELNKFYSESFIIGVNAVSLRVRDNDGTWSAWVPAIFEVRGYQPVAYVDSIIPRSLIIKGRGDVTFYGRAWDQDESANNQHDSLMSFKWFSTLQGELGSNKIQSVSSAALVPGYHGFYSQATDDEGQAVTSDTLFIPVQAGTARAVIIAGNSADRDPFFFTASSPGIDAAYEAMRARGLTDDDIYYMGPVSWQDGTIPLLPGWKVDNTNLTTEAVHSQLLNLIVGTREGRPLYLCLAGHGDIPGHEGSFYLSDGEFITPDTLAAWLSEFGDLNSSSRIVTVLDFSYSGMFQARLASAANQSRLVISSAAREAKAAFSGGKSFSWKFWGLLAKGVNMRTAFDSAAFWANDNSIGTLPNPEINTNGNALTNEPNDLILASRMFLGGNQADTARMPEILTVSRSETPKGLISLDVAVSGSMSKVWYTLYPPDENPDLDVSLLKTGNCEMGDDSLYHCLYNGDVSAAGDYVFMVGGRGGGHMVYPVSHLMPVAEAGLVPVQVVVKSLSSMPNPFNTVTVIRAGVPEAQKITVSIFDIEGRLLKTLFDGPVNPGYHLFEWNGTDAGGRTMSSGMYLYRLTGRDFVMTRKVILDR